LLFYTQLLQQFVLQKTNLIETVNGKDYSSMPAWFTKWETTGLLTFEDKNGDGKIQYYTTTPRTQHF
jgi:cation/acetate symporter